MKKLLRESTATLLGTVGIWCLSAAARLAPSIAQISFEDDQNREVPQVSEVAGRIHWSGKSEDRSDSLRP